VPARPSSEAPRTDGCSLLPGDSFGARIATVTSPSQRLLPVYRIGSTLVLYYWAGRQVSSRLPVASGAVRPSLLSVLGWSHGRAPEPVVPPFGGRRGRTVGDRVTKLFSWIMAAGHLRKLLDEVAARP
jgi:hypothetical protein